MSHEEGLVTKKRVAAHINYFLKFKTASCSSTLVIKPFNSSRNLKLLL